MTDFDEDLIWDTITASAKERIDYTAFTAFFPFPADNLLSSIVYGFAAGRTAEDISARIGVQVKATGNTVDADALLQFVSSAPGPLALEITLTRQALHALNEGAGEEEVYGEVLEALGNGGREFRA